MYKFFIKIKSLRQAVLFWIILLVLVLPAFFSGGNNIYIKEIVQALSVIVFLIFIVYANNKNNRLDGHILLLLSAFFIIFLLSGLFSSSIYDSLSYWLELFCSGLIFYAVAKLKIEEPKIEQIFKTFLGSAVILSFIGFYFYISGNYARLTSTFYWPNPFAGYLLFAWPLAIHFLFKERKKIVWLLVLSVLLSAFILTGSRGADISFFIVILAYGLFFRKEIIRNRYWLIAALLIVFGTVLIFSYSKPDNFFDRSKLSEASVLDASSSIKLDYWLASFKIFKDNFFFGAGPASFQTIYPIYQPNPISSGKYPHNWFLELLAEGGVIAALLFAVFIYFVFYRVLKNGRSDSFKMALLAGVLGSVIHNLVDIDWHFSANFIAFWIFIGFLSNLSVDKHAVEEKEKVSKIIRLVIFIVLSALLFKNVIFIRSYYYYEKGLVAQSQYNFESAGANYKKSLFLNPHPDYLRKYGIILFTLGINTENSEVKRNYLEKALAVANKLEKFDRNNSLNNELRGKIFLAQDNLKEAELNFKQAILLDRFNYPRFYGELAALLIGAERSGEAKALLLNSLNSFPENVIENRKIIIMNNQKITSGIAEAISDWYYLLGLISFKENNSQEARKYFSLALNLNPDNRPANDLIKVLK